MLSPPFSKRSIGLAAPCCETQETPPAAEDASPHQRTRLAQLDPHLHCSVIGTCLGSAELRRLMARFIDVAGLGELDVHHEAVRLASRHADVGKALHKAMDLRYAAALRRFAAAADEVQIGAAWDEARQQGEIPGAYWALLTHRHCTPALRQRAFGEVHMLSHLVGAANRADLRRLVALERENGELAERLEREQQRRQDLVDEREALAARMQQQAIALAHRTVAEAAPVVDTLQSQTLIGLHTQRREQAEHAAAQARAALEQALQEVEHLRRQSRRLGRELAAAETQLRATSEPTPQPLPADRRALLYVGGRPSTIPAIRALVERQGGEFLHHDGGLETRKGLLAALVQKAQWVLFPVDCIDHDSALNLKRLAERQGIPFSALRSASVASFAAALAAPDGGAEDGDDDSAAPPFCLRHA